MKYYIHFPLNSAAITDISLMGDTRLQVRYDGMVMSIPPAHLKAACVMDMTFWPYDTHNCTVKYGSWVYDGVAINLNTLARRPEVSCLNWRLSRQSNITVKKFG